MVAWSSLGWGVLAGPMPLSPAGLRASRLGDDSVRLEWAPVTADIYGDPVVVVAYRLYASADPRFAPDFGEQSNLLAETEATSFVHTDALSVQPAWFYYVTAVTADGAESFVVPQQLAAQRIQVACPPDSRRFMWLALPDSVVATSASLLAAELGHVDRVYRFDPDAQAYETWDVGSQSGTDFPVVAGDVVALRFNESAVLNLLGCHAPGQSFAWTHAPSRFNHYWVAFPPNSPIRTADEVVATIPESTKAARYNVATQRFESWFWLSGRWLGRNFSVAPGEPIQVSLGADSSWQVPSPCPQPTIALENGIGFIDLHDLVATAAVVSEASPIVEYAWDFEGDGVFDRFEMFPSTEVRHRFSTPGTARPTLRVRNLDGFYGVAHASFIALDLDLTFDQQAFRAALGESGALHYTVSHAGAFTVQVFSAAGDLVRTLEEGVWHEAGDAQLSWDGRNAEAELVDPGVFYVRVTQAVPPHSRVYDPTHLLLGSNIATQTTEVFVPSEFAPYAGGQFPIRYTLASAARVTLSIQDDSGTTLARVCSDALRTAGPQTDYWDGRLLSGAMIESGQSFKVALNAVSVGSNALIVDEPRPTLANLTASAARLMPAANPYGLSDHRLTLTYDLNVNADIAVEVRSRDGALVRSALEPGKPSGSNQTIWPGTDDVGRLVAAGLYSVTLTPESDGYRGQPATIWVEAYY